VKFTTAIDEFIADKRSEGRINSDRTEAGYRLTLEAHAADVGNRDPRTVGREDVKRTLRRWEHPNTQAYNRAVLVSFYRWTVQEGRRPFNPAEQTRAPKRRKPSVYRLTRAEAIRMMRACDTERERRVVFIGLLAGARNQELRLMGRRHFERPGAVWFSEDIAKGARERWVPVLAELEPVVEEILEHVGDGEFIVPARRSAGGRQPNSYRELPAVSCSTQALIDVVVAVGQRAAIAARVKPHCLRHAFGDHVARAAGLRAAQAMLGHADVSTTEGSYTGGVLLDELAAAVGWFRYDGYPSTDSTKDPEPRPSRTLPAEATSGAPTGAISDHDEGEPT
jgi:integrase